MPAQAQSRIGQKEGKKESQKGKGRGEAADCETERERDGRKNSDYERV